MLRHPYILGGPQRQARGAKSELGPHPCLLKGTKEGGNATSTLHCPGSPMQSVESKIRKGCLSLAFLEAQKRAEMLRNPYILGGPQRQSQ